MEFRPVDIQRLEGTLVANPTQHPATAGTSYPYGGTVLGAMVGKVLSSKGDAYTIWDESTGSDLCSTQPDNSWGLSGQLRGSDDDAIDHFFRGGAVRGRHSQRSGLEVPGSRWPGQDTADIALRLLLYPEDLVHHDALLIYHGVPTWTAEAEAAFQRSEEHLIPITVQILPDSQERWMAKRRLADLYLPT